MDVKSGLLGPEGSGWGSFHLAQLTCKAEQVCGGMGRSLPSCLKQEVFLWELILIS